MGTSLILIRSVLLGTALLVVSGSASAVTIVDTSSGLAGGQGGLFVSSIVSAHDFTLTQSTTLTDLRVWLDDRTTISNDDGVLNDFSGTLSWGIFSDASGPTSTILATGFDSSPVLTDTGLQNAVDADVVQVDVVMNITLAAGTYWLAIHEGAWLSPFDGSQVEWSRSTASSGAGGYQESNETNPGGSWSSVGSLEGAFILTGTLPEPSTALLLVSGLTAGIASGRKRARADTLR